MIQIVESIAGVLVINKIVVMENKYTKIYKKKKDHLLVTADLSHALRTINNNTNWKNNSTKFPSNLIVSNKTITPEQLTKNLMNEEDLERLFHKSKEKLRTQATNTHHYTDWGNKNVKDFVSSVKFLKIDDETDKLLTGMPTTTTEQDEELINFLFAQDQKQDLTTSFKKDYLVGKVVGEGAYASVRVAIYKPLNKKVAIKIYEKNKIKQMPRKKSLRREIKILQMLNHPNIVEIWDVVETNNHVNLIMEYLTGISLNSYMKLQPGHKIPQKNSKKIIRALADALRFLHERNISHRDIKLENVIIDQNLNPKLIDFGFSTCIEPTKKIKIFCGTPSYMAPEIIQKREYRGQAADIWALGVLSYVMITGIFPFKGATDEELYKKINRADYNKAELLFSKDLCDLINRMLTIDPLARITAQQILNHPWVRTSSSSLLKKTKRAESSCEYRKKTTTSSHKSHEKMEAILHSYKKFNETCKQNIKMELKLIRESPQKLHKTCTQRKIQKQLVKLGNERNMTRKQNEKTGSSSIQKKEPLSKFQKTNKILDLLQNESKKRAVQDKSKNKQRRY